MRVSLLKVVREMKGVSQHELSARTGIPNYRISLIENRWRKPKPEELQKLSEALELDVSSLLDDEKILQRCLNAK